MWEGRSYALDLNQLLYGVPAANVLSAANMNRLLLAYFAIGAVGFNKSQVIGRFFSNVSAVSVKDEVATFKSNILQYFSFS